MDTARLLLPYAVILFGVLTGPWLISAPAAELPVGFSTFEIEGPWQQAVGMTFAEDGTMVVWERTGHVHLHDGSAWHLVIDIHDEVGSWGDHGLLGLALHPNFLTNGRIYLMYVVDRHHLDHAGTPEYDPEANEYFRPTIGRITRYRLDPADGFRSVVPGSRVVLLGETKSTGIPILFTSHGVGTLLFGSDGTLLASCGDGASFAQLDTGGAASYAPEALAEGIIQPKEDVGAFRAQLVDALSGKILRLHPLTGDGMSSNPYFDLTDARAPRSRVWALGLRNPYRVTRRPGTGASWVGAANPGVLFIGDVGWNQWEEHDTCAAPGQNFGWPVFEGLTQSNFATLEVENLDAPNPLAGQPGCEQPYFYFTDLIQQDALAPPPLMNPCDAAVEIPATIPTFVHRRPEIDWGRPDGPARTGIYVGGAAATAMIGAKDSPVAGPQFGGRCVIGGAWYTGLRYPAAYRNTFFFADFNNSWIMSAVFDDAHEAVAVQPFAAGTFGVMTIAAHPVTGDLYYVVLGTVHHLVYAPCVADIVSSETLAPPPDGVVDGADLALLLFEWGDASDGGSIADIVSNATFNPPADGHVDAADLAWLLSTWGECE